MTLHEWLTAAEFLLAAITIVAVFFVAAPYGRHTRGGFGSISVPARWAWVVMESPAVLWFLWIFFSGRYAHNPVSLVLLGLWMSHYVHRTFLYPFTIRSAKPWPLLVPTLGFAFQLLNATINAQWIGNEHAYTLAWFGDPRFVLGTVLFVVGWLVNRHSDHVVARLRGPGETEYKIPHGGLYRWVSAPNYLGEIILWSGWALATWSWAGLAFAVYTVANLAPRALQHHRWYREQFADYPASRRALVPFLL